MEKRLTHKLGGKAVDDADAVLSVSEREMAAAPGKAAMMVSAYARHTQMLLKASDTLMELEQVTPKLIASTLEDFRGAVIGKFESIEGGADEAKVNFEKDIKAVEKFIKEVAKSEEGFEAHTMAVRDRLLSLGESSGRQGTTALLNANGIPAYDLGAVSAHEGTNHVNKRIQGGFGDVLGKLDSETQSQILVGGGFVHNLNGGILTELSRSYTDTAAVDLAVSMRKLGMGDGSVVFWKPEPGMMTANPTLLNKEVQKAQLLEDISLYEALEVARMGSSLLHVAALELALREKINLTLKGIKTPEIEGTNYSVSSVPSSMPFKTVATHPHDTMYLDIAEVSGEAGVAEQLLAIFREAGISVNDIITEGNTISYTMPLPEDKPEIDALRKKLRDIQQSFYSIEINGVRRNIQSEWDKGNMANVSVVGSELANQEGILAGLTTVLASVGINIDQVAHTKNQNRISFYVPHADRNHAVRAIHMAYFDKPEAFAKIMAAARASTEELLLSAA